MPDGPPPRFIAGAVCPGCGAMDRIVVDTDEHGAQRRRCVSCGFVDSERPGASQPPGTRFSRPPGERSGPAMPVTARTVKIVPRESVPGRPRQGDDDA